MKDAKNRAIVKKKEVAEKMKPTPYMKEMMKKSRGSKEDHLVIGLNGLKRHTVESGEIK